MPTSSDDFRESVFANSMDAVLLTDPSGAILRANAAAEEMFEMTAAELCAGGRALVVDMTDARLGPLLERRRQHGRARGELTFKRKDGTRFAGEISSAIFDTPNGPRSSMIIRDVTASRAIETRMHDLEKVSIAAQWAAAVAHELNNPLAFVVASLSEMRETLFGINTPTEESMAELRAMLDEVIVGVERISALSRDFGRISRPGSPTQAVVVDVPALVARVVGRWAPAERAAGGTAVIVEGEVSFSVRASVADVEEAVACLLDYLGVRFSSKVMVAFAAQDPRHPSVTFTAVGQFLSPRERGSLFDPRLEVEDTRLRLDLKLPLALTLLRRNDCELTAFGDETEPLRFELKFTAPAS